MLMGKTLVIGPSGAGKTYLAGWGQRHELEAYDADQIVGLTAWFDNKGRVVSFLHDAGKEFTDNHEFLWRKELMEKWLVGRREVIIFGLSGYVFEMLEG